jgi:hypothetical protein
MVKIISWDASQGSRTIMVVESIKMVVVIPNRNMDPEEWDKGPLELQERREGKFECSHGRRINLKWESARTEVS